jgi:hypothetical protein
MRTWLRWHSKHLLLHWWRNYCKYLCKYHSVNASFCPIRQYLLYLSSKTKYIHTYTYIPLMLYPRRGSRGISNIPPRHPRFTKISLIAMWLGGNTADVTGGKLIAVLLQSISGVSAINPLVAFYNIHGGKREVLYFVPDTTRDILNTCNGYRQI